MAAGIKTGGRRKGAPNKAKKAEREEIAASGLMPLDYMLSVLRNEFETPERRAWAADKAGPYCHPRLAQIEHGNKAGEKFIVSLEAKYTGIL